MRRAGEAEGAGMRAVEEVVEEEVMEEEKCCLVGGGEVAVE